VKTVPTLRTTFNGWERRLVHGHVKGSQKLLSVKIRQVAAANSAVSTTAVAGCSGCWSYTV